MASRSSRSVIPASFRMVDAVLFTFSKASSTGSRETNSSPISLEYWVAFWNTSFVSRLRYGSPPDTLGRESICLSSTSAICWPFMPSFWKMKLVTFSPTFITLWSTCTGSMACCPRLCTRFTASCTASCALMVKLLKFIFCSPFYFISFITLGKAQKICHWHISDKLSAYKICKMTNCL